MYYICNVYYNISLIFRMWYFSRIEVLHVMQILYYHNIFSFLFFVRIICYKDFLHPKRIVSFESFYHILIRLTFFLYACLYFTDQHWCILHNSTTYIVSGFLRDQIQASLRIPINLLRLAGFADFTMIENEWISSSWHTSNKWMSSSWIKMWTRK